jgi:hypothetical protein
MNPTNRTQVTAAATSQAAQPKRTQATTRRGTNRVADNNTRTHKSWNELRDEAGQMTLAVVDAGTTNVTFRITPKHPDQELTSETKRALKDLILKGGNAHIVDPNGCEEGVRQT